jgi:hypothetical protein
MFSRILVALVIAVILGVVSGQYGYYYGDGPDRPDYDRPDYNGPDNYYHMRPPMPFMRGPFFHHMRRPMYW